MLHGEWRVQVLALQSYIKPKEVIYGSYTRPGEKSQKSQAQVHNCLLQVAQSLNAASPLDRLTESMAHYAETAYASIKDMAPDGDLAQELQHHTTVHIVNMSAEFIVDEHDKLWYCHRVLLLFNSLLSIACAFMHVCAGVFVGIPAHQKCWCM
jgi:hypothetical protein